MKKTYVLDTNILIQSPAACTCFEDNDVVLPLAVLEELDGLKRAEGDRGYSAREAIRRLEEAGVLETLPDKLKLTASLRQANPELSLSELAEEFDPPVTKSCWNHRLRKLVDLSKKL